MQPVLANMPNNEGKRARLQRVLGQVRPAPTLALVAVVLLATWMAARNGGYFVQDWTPVALVLAALLLAASLVAALGGAASRWSVAAGGLLAAYALWTLASLSWSPNRGDAWLGAGLTLLYLLAFCVTVVLVSSSASRRWALAASVLGPAVLAAAILAGLGSRLDLLFENARLMGTVGYFNGQAAFLLLPFWVGVYLAGSPRVNPFLRGAVLAGLVLNLSVAFMSQSRGAMLAFAVSAPVFFLFSSQRLRGLLAVAPVAAGLVVCFPALNGLYLAFLDGGAAAPDRVADRVVLAVSSAAAGAGLYGVAWGALERRWKPPAGVARAAGVVVVAGAVVVASIGFAAFGDGAQDPLRWTEQKWQAFKSDDNAGQERSRYLSASGSGRYELWQIAWKGFSAHPVLGVGTHNYEATFYRLREEPSGFVRQPHSLPLEVLGERGAVGGVLLSGFLAVCLTAGLFRRFGRLNAEGGAQIGAMTAAVAYWFVHSSAEWFWQIPAVTMPAMLYLAMLAAPWHRGQVAERSATPRLLWASGGAGLALLTAVVVFPLAAAAFHLERSEAAATPREALRQVERAQGFNPLDPALAQREAELAGRAGDLARAEDAYSRAMALNPEHYAPPYLLASVYEAKGEYGKALSLYEKARDLNPMDGKIDRRIARLEATGRGLTAGSGDGRGPRGRPATSEGDPR